MTSRSGHSHALTRSIRPPCHRSRRCYSHVPPVHTQLHPSAARLEKQPFLEPRSLRAHYHPRMTCSIVNSMSSQRQVSRVAVDDQQWLSFRQAALSRGISVSAYLGKLVEAEVKRRAGRAVANGRARGAGRSAGDRGAGRGQGLDRRARRGRWPACPFGDRARRVVGRRCERASDRVQPRPRRPTRSGRGRRHRE